MIKSSFIFCAFSSWIQGIYNLSIENFGLVSWMSIAMTGGIVVVDFLSVETFLGTTPLVLILVMGTVFANTGFGIAKNLIKAKVFFAQAQKHESTTIAHRVQIRKWEAHKFDYKRTYFVFFKSFSFLAYLLIAKALMSDDVVGAGIEIKALYITTEILIRVPIALFWYYEFKSIGENSEYIFGKKASIFNIVEGIFEPRIFKFFGSKTPADGVHEEKSEDYPKQDNNQTPQ